MFDLKACLNNEIQLIAYFHHVSITLRAVVSPGRTLRYDGRKNTASNRLMEHARPRCLRQNEAFRIN